ncbi:hypothetical protein LZZ90_00670 [Flavobacterium sp. SM15]|uniref:hypothetical protein n=1 Tax=Flavobacterium sp. SM15 TaxID=2908005 RepID=UPI001EDAD85F|nr:hypothetical protein [Flavobacterium sp. SM15]MCG2610015.1 hypothetical protein [Flavobacterium sp. SM15]
MSKKLQSNGDVSICHNGNCIHATGQNANLIATGVFTMFLLIGIAALIKDN